MLRLYTYSNSDIITVTKNKFPFKFQDCIDVVLFAL